LTAFITPIFLAYSSSGPYFLFAGLTAFTLAVLLIYMPETRGRSLESIQGVFQPPAFLGKVMLNGRLRRRMRWGRAVRMDTSRSTGFEGQGGTSIQMQNLALECEL
jgi:hypothetical protein